MKYFPNGFKQGTVSEVIGTAGSGKTFFLFLLIQNNCLNLFSKENDSTIIYFDALEEFNNDFVKDYFKVIFCVY